MSLVTEWERKTIRTTDDEEEEAIHGESYLCQGPAEHGNEWKIEKSNLKMRKIIFEKKLKLKWILKKFWRAKNCTPLYYLYIYT